LKSLYYSLLRHIQFIRMPNDIKIDMRQNGQKNVGECGEAPVKFKYIILMKVIVSMHY